MKYIFFSFIIILCISIFIFNVCCICKEGMEPEEIQVDLDNIEKNVDSFYKDLSCILKKQSECDESEQCIYDSDTRKCNQLL